MFQQGFNKKSINWTRNIVVKRTISSISIGYCMIPFRINYSEFKSVFIPNLNKPKLCIYFQFLNITNNKYTCLKNVLCDNVVLLSNYYIIIQHYYRLQLHICTLLNHINHLKLAKNLQSQGKSNFLINHHDRLQMYLAIFI